MDTASIQRDVPITPSAATSGAAAITAAESALWKFLAPFEQMVQGLRAESSLKPTRLSLQVGGAAIFWQTRLVYGTEPRKKKANARKLKLEAQPQLHRSGFNTSDHARGQGAGRSESAATMAGC
jgi:hypothetical protein